MKKITVSVTVADGWPYNSDEGRALKNDMADAALTRIRESNLDFIAIEATVGTVRTRKK